MRQINKIVFLVLTTGMFLLNSCGPETRNVSIETTKSISNTGCNIPSVLNELAKAKLISTGNGDDMIIIAPNGGYKTVGGSVVTQEYFEMKLNEALEKKQISKSLFDSCMK